MFKRLIFVVVSFICIIPLYNVCFAQSAKPVVLYPRSGQKVYSGDSMAVRYYADEGKECRLLIWDDQGPVVSKKLKSGTLLRNGKKDKYSVGSGGLYLLPADMLMPDKRYFIQVTSDFKVSEPVAFNTVSEYEKPLTKGIFSRLINSAAIGNKYSRILIAPDNLLTSAALANRLMETIEVDVWKIDGNNKKYTSKIKLTVNKNLKNNYINVFKELYSIAFPIKSAGCYNYRNTHGGRLSEHAMGTAVDINPDENYCIYSDGTVVGKYYRPYKDPYSVTPEVISIFKKYGFEWGGAWTGTVDNMHFAYFDS